MHSDQEAGAPHVLPSRPYIPEDNLRLTVHVCINGSCDVCHLSLWAGFPILSHDTASHCSVLTLVADFGHWVNNISHIYLYTVDGHLGSFQHLTISYNAVVTILVPVFGIHTYAFLMGVIVGVWLLGHGSVYTQLWEMQAKLFYSSFWIITLLLV